MKIGILIGSLRHNSFNRKIAQEIINLGDDSLDMQIIEIGNLPFYNPDLDENPPQSWVEFRLQAAAMDAFLFITPEYNRSTPAALKNALDVGSRPYGKSIWNNKSCAVISFSVGAVGGFGANHHLRQSLVFLNMPCMQQPEMYLGQIDKSFNEAGELINPDLKNILNNFTQAYKAWITA